MIEKYKNKLAEGLAFLNITASDEQLKKLLNYHQLLVKWNKAYNLTAVRDPEQMIQRHLFDSLSVVKYIEGQRLIDVGTGGGLPGIILAIIFPERELHLLDSNGKKTRFLFQVKTELKLSNVTIHHCRVEEHYPERLYDGIVSRAFATLLDMVNGSHHLLTTDGYFYAMKGIYPTEELRALPKIYKVEACHTLSVPDEEGRRHLVVMAQHPVDDNASVHSD